MAPGQAPWMAPGQAPWMAPGQAPWMAAQRGRRTGSSLMSPLLEVPNQLSRTSL
jgi:hypothetical protein